MSFEELDALRESIGLPQAKLCQRGEINPATYSRWRRYVRGEDGGAKPTQRSLRAVRDVLATEVARRADRSSLAAAS